MVRPRRRQGITLAGASDRLAQPTDAHLHGGHHVIPRRLLKLLRPGRLAVLLALLAASVAVCVVGGTHLRAWYHLHAARHALERYHNEEARRHLQVCLRSWPKDATTRLLAARAARRTEDFEEAQRQLEECQRLDPRSEAAVLEWALLQAHKGRLDLAERYLCRLVDEGHPDTPLVLEALAQGYLRMYRLSNVLSCVEHWLGLQPDSVPALLCRGRAWERVHDYGKAVEDYRRVIQRDAELDEARLRLANALIEGDSEDRYEEATIHLEHLYGRRPADPEVLVRLASCRANLNRTEEALRLLEGLLAERPDYEPALCGRGRLLLEQGRVAEAEPWLRRAVITLPYDHMANYALYRCLMQQPGKEAEAAVLRDRLNDLERDLTRLKAISNQEMSLRPRDPALHCELGAIMLRIGQDEYGERWLLSALQCDLRYRPAHAALADYYQRKGEGTKAARHRALARTSGKEPQP
jgi:tetratricopeptide (TPR) repeat protein